MHSQSSVIHNSQNVGTPQSAAQQNLAAMKGNEGADTSHCEEPSRRPAKWKKPITKIPVSGVFPSLRLPEQSNL